MTTLDAPPRTPTRATHIDPRDLPDEPVRGWWDRWWIAALVLPLMVVSDWKLRRRAATSALSGQADAQVLVEIAVYGLVAVVLALRYGRAPRLRRTTWLLFAMWFYGATLFFSAFYAVYPTLAIARGTQMIIGCALAQTIATRARIDQLHRFAHAYLALMAFAVVLGVVAPLPISNKVAGRFHWLYVHPVPGAMFLTIALIVALAYARSRELRSVLNVWPQWVYGALTLVFVVAVILTKTRGSIGGAFVGVIALFVYHTRTKTKVDTIAFGTVLATAVALLIGPLILSYLARGEDIQKISTLNERTNLWGDAFAKFVQRPIEGYGLGASRGIFLEEIRLGGGHNAFVNAMVDAGSIGLISFVALLAVLGWTLWHFRRGTPGHRDALILLPLLVALVVNSMTAEFVAVPATTASLWLFVMIAWASVDQRAGKSYDVAETGLGSLSAS